MKPTAQLFLITLCICASLATTAQARAQTRVSMSSDFNLQRSLKKGQKYWAVGQTVTVQFNATPVDAAYAWVAYFSNGRFGNALIADAKSPVTTPSTIPYESATKMRYKHISLGWKHYYIGTAVADSRKFGLYSMTGLGLMLGLVQNAQSVVLDTMQYHLPVLPGKENFKRLTLDLGIGGEVAMGADLYFYAELKAVLPLTDAPNRYILDNKYTPYTAMAALGFRILFN